MAIRRSRKPSSKKLKNRRKLLSPVERHLSREMQLERLEERQLLAGAQLIGIQPNDGELLQHGDILNVAPTDLTFRFDESQRIDPLSLGTSSQVGGIQITRSNLDGIFTPASVTYDFNSGGAVRVKFSAVRLGQDQNGIRLTFTASDFGGPGLPGISVVGRTINVNLNLSQSNQTTAFDLLAALNNSVAASNLISAEVVSGDGLTNIASTTPANSSKVLGDPNDPNADVSNDIVVLPGFIGVSETPATNEVVFRFAGDVPDDTYRIDVFGSGDKPLNNVDGELYLEGADSSQTFDLDLAPQVIAVVPQPVTRLANGAIQQDRSKIRVYFNNDDLNVAAAQNPAFYQLIHTAETLENRDDVVFNPISVVYNAGGDYAELTFAGDLDLLVDPTGSPVGAGVFRLRIGTDEVKASVVGDNGLPLSPTVTTYDAEATATLNGVTFHFRGLDERWGKALRIVVTSSDHEDASGPDVNVLDNVVTVDLNTNAANRSTAAQLRDALNNHFNAGDMLEVTITAGADTDVLADASLVYPPVTLSGVGSSFGLATDLGTLSAQNQLIRGVIDPQVYTLDLPGGNDDPGHREISDQHIPDNSADIVPGITRIEYTFRQDIGSLPDGRGGTQPAYNLITETQKRRAREAMQVLSQLTGVEFVETETDGVIIASGDPITTPNPANTGLLVMDANLDDRFQGTWFRSALSSIGGFLGLGATWDLPGMAIRGSDANLNFGALESIVLSDNDLVHLQHLYHPESKDIDLYKFNVQAVGRLTVETMAERQLEASLLDSSLSLFRENPDGSRTLVARNDDYYSHDSFIDVHVTPGTYYVGVSASGNEEYDPTIEDSGFGGTSDGEYELRLNFRPDITNIANAIYDADNPTGAPTFIDGDADGVPGGVFDFWFKAQTAANTIFVDKLAVPGMNVGMKLYNNVNTALSAAQPGQIVRIIGNPGADGDMGTLGDNAAYQIGFDTLGRALPDGSTMEIPKGVTVMVDAGAIFQMRRARIGVGSSSPGIDRSGGAFQVLGTPWINDKAGTPVPGSVYFTSYNDQQTGLDTNPYTTTPAAGDWGGLVFRDDNDRSEGRFVYDEEGIFLNYVNHADMRYGGGNVLINSVATVVNPIHITDTRPTVSFNTITLSADAAMSASPDSFEETNFHAPRHQRIAFTSDYDRIGPQIHGNNIVKNSINGLFIRVNTQAGSTAQKLNISGRWDDTDIVHVVSENVVIASQPGGIMERSTAPPTRLITATAVTSSGGSLGVAGGSRTYAYKFTYIDRFGYESPASTALRPVTVNGLGSIQLTQLPPAASGYVARRIYRSENNGPFELVAQVDGRSTTYLDKGMLRDGVLHVPPVQGVTLVEQPGGSLLPGTYNYRVTFVDETGKESQPSDATASRTVTGNPDVLGGPGNGTIVLNQLPAPVASGYFETVRIYRSGVAGAGPYTLIAELAPGTVTYTDDGLAMPGVDATAVLDTALESPRLDARLSIDPSLVVKVDGARFEVQLGAQFIAEGDDGREVIFTSIADDRYGAGGTFDTGNDGAIVLGSANAPEPGDWGGIYAGHLSKLNVDNALFAYGGGVTRVEGTFAAFNTIEIHEQADARIANSVFEFNARGQGGQGEADRFGRGTNQPGVIFVRQAQPVIYNNVIRNNNSLVAGVSIPAININVNALNRNLMRDSGRTTGEIDRVEGYRDNRGPLILDNQLQNNDVNGMLVRGQTLTTQSIWDDTSIVHVLMDTVNVADFHTYGGLTLASSPTESLVVKLLDNPTTGEQAGFRALGVRHEIEDRIGGIIQIVGQPGSPVVLTSLLDDSHGAGQRPDGDPQTDTNNDGTATSPSPGDWTSIRFDEYAHDRNVETYFEAEARDVNSPGTNASPDDAQLLGVLAPSEYAADENRRLGFNVYGFLNDAKDVDVYSFKAIPQTEVWIDLDRTTHAFDPVIEVLDSNGTVVARSDNSTAEIHNANNLLEPSERVGLAADPSLLVGEARLMQKTPPADGVDRYTTNPRDAALRLLLPGIADPQNPDVPQTYHVRVRSSSPDLTNLQGGLTSGAYEMQIRLREADEVAGSTVRFATISYATNGIEIYGMPGHSPLLGEATEYSVFGNDNDDFNRAQYVGNLLVSDRAAISVAGNLYDFEYDNPATAWIDSDIDFFEFHVRYQDTTITDAFNTIFDIDYADGLDRPDTAIYVFSVNPVTLTTGNLVYTSRDSNIGEDRAAPLGAADLDDLSRGSVGAADPYIGSVSLPVGIYRVAITDAGVTPDELDQFTSANATNPNARLEPIESIRRVADDHIDFVGSGPADPPQTNRLFDPDFGNLLEFTQEVDWHLGDVVLYLSEDYDTFDDQTQTRLRTYDPFTGAWETDVGNFDRETGDIAMQRDGQLYSFSIGLNEDLNAGIVCAPTDALSGQYLQISPANGTATQIGEDGIVTYQMDPANANASIVAHTCQAAQQGYGLQFNAIAYGPNGAYAIGDRGDSDPAFQAIGPEIFENILYQFTAADGAAFSGPNDFDRVDNVNIPEHLYDEAGTQIRERGEMLTSPRLEGILATLPATTGIASTSELKDGETFTVIDGANRFTFEFDTGPEVTQRINTATATSIRDGDFFQLDDNLFQLDVGSVIVFTGGLSDNSVISVNDDSGNSASFEFNRVPDPTPPPPRQDPTATEIQFGFGTSPIQLAGLLAAAINANANLTTTAVASGNRVTLERDQAVDITPSGVQGVILEGGRGAAPILQAVDGSQIADEEWFQIQVRSPDGLNTTQQVFEFDSGFMIRTPVRHTLQVPATGGRGIDDGETFVITNGGVSVTFEFDRDGVLTTVTNPDHVISYTPADSADQIATVMESVLSNAALGLDLRPRNIGGGVVHLGTQVDNTLDTTLAPSMITNPAAVSAGIQQDGEIIAISNGLGTTIRFEFDYNDGNFVDNNGDGNPDNQLIVLDQADTHDEIADKIATAIAGSGLFLTPTNLGNGLIHLGGDDGLPLGNPNHSLDTSGAVSVSQSGRPGLANPVAIAIDYVPSASFTATDVANAINTALNSTGGATSFTHSAQDGDGYADGQLLTIDNGGIPVVFEFNNAVTDPFNTNRLVPSAIPINFSPSIPAAPPAPAVPATTATVMAQRIFTAISGAVAPAPPTVSLAGTDVVVTQFPIQLNSRPVNDRVVVNGRSITFSPGTSRLRQLPATQIDGVEEAYGVVSPSAGRGALVPAAYTGRDLTDHFIATRVAAVVGAHPDYDDNGLPGVGGSFSRINFPYAQTADFSGVPVWTQVATSDFGVSTGNIRIPFLADDQPQDRYVDYDIDGIADRVGGTLIQMPGLSTRIADAINTNLQGISTITATVTGRYVRLSRGDVDNNSGIGAQGSGPGGIITGATFVGNTMYAVSDQGGLYRIVNPASPNATTDYIESSQDDLLGIEFSGLTTGPQSVEGSRYANMMFATDIDGRLYAFDATGELQPVFVDGQTNISTGGHFTEVRGLAFSTLDQNLFRVTPGTPHPSTVAFPVNAQGPSPMDQRLGLQSPAPDTRIQVDYRDSEAGHEGGSSIHFGQGYAYDLADNPLGPRSYEFPGGAYGTLVSNEFSLKGYSAADRPVLYFSYWQDLEDVNEFATLMTDAFKVFIADNDGDWQMLTTNNSVGGEDLSEGPFDVQETYDEDAVDEDWRQVRVPLDQYAGRENLRLRIDFSTAADMNVGDVYTTGAEVRAVAGVYINDGDSFLVDNRRIEFETGLTLVTPTGGAIQDGEWLTVTDDLNNQVKLQFTNNVLTLDNIIATDGSNLQDGDTFAINDGTSTVQFEFNTDYIIRVPANGGAGIADRETFTIDRDGALNGHLPISFEIDKNGVFVDADGVAGPDNDYQINLIPNWTLRVPVNGGAGINDQNGFSISNGTQTYTFEFDQNGVKANPSATLIDFTRNMTLQMPVTGGAFGGVLDGHNFTITAPDGTPVVFEFDDDGVYGNIPVSFTHFTTRDDLADAVVNAVNIQSAALGLNAVHTGGGLVVLNQTQRLHTLNAGNSPATPAGFQAVSQEDLAQRIMNVLNATPGPDVLGLVPVYDGAGNIVFHNTLANHVMFANGIGLGRTELDQDTVAQRIANKIDQWAIDEGNISIDAVNIGDGMVQVVDTLEGNTHVIDMAAAPGLTLTGRPGLATGTEAVDFLPNSTTDDVVSALVTAINAANAAGRLDVLATPDREVVLLSGTTGNTVTFASGTSALEPENVIPIYLDPSQTSNEVAERIALAIGQAVARGDLSPAVVTHLNDDLGYDSPSIAQPQPRTNRLNLEGIVDIQFSRTDTSLRVDGAIGRNNIAGDPNSLLVPIHTDMTRVEVANALDTALESLFHNQTIITQTGLSYTDGDTFILDDGVNAPVVYEFDSGYVIQIPVGGGSVAAGGLADGDTITVTDISGTVSAVFEFDKDGTVQGTNAQVFIRETDSAAGVAQSLVQAMNNHPSRTLLGLTPRVVTGNRVQIGGSTGATLTFSPGTTLQRYAPSVFEIPLNGGAAIPDGAVVSFTDGVTTASFEFDRLGGVIPGNFPIPYQTTWTANQIATALVTAIATHPNRGPLDLNAVQLDATHVAVQMGSEVRVNNSFFAFTARAAGEPGVAPAATISLPQTLTLLLNEGLTLHIPSGGIVDGETFTLNDGANSVTFEFEDLNIGNGAAPTNSVIGFTAASSLEEIAQTMRTRIANSGLDVQPTVLGGVGNIDLGAPGYFSYTLPLGSNLIRTGPLSLQTPLLGGQGIADGDSFQVSDGSRTVTFEFENTAVGDGVTVGAREISYNAGDTRDQLALKIAAAIAAVPGWEDVVNPVLSTGTPRVYLGLASSVIADTSATHLTQTGYSRQLPDGTTFVLTDGTLTRSFEIDTNNSLLTAGIGIDLFGGSTLHQIATQIVTEINNSGVTGLIPVDEGNGRIHIGGTNLHQLDTSAVPGMSTDGVGGPIQDGDSFIIAEAFSATRFEFDLGDGVTAGSVAIPFAMTDSTDTIAASVLAAISPGSSGLNNLFPAYLGDGTINVGGNETHTVNLTSNLTVRNDLLVQIPTGGVFDGQTFSVSDGDRAYVFEFDNNGTSTPGNFPIAFTAGDSQNDIANATVRAIENITVLPFHPRNLGNGLVDLGGDETLYQATLPLTMTPAQQLWLQAPENGGGIAGVVDGEVFTLSVTDPATPTVVTDYVFEFESYNPATYTPYVDPAPAWASLTRIPVYFTATDDQNDLARAMVQALAAAEVAADVAIAGGAIGLAPLNLSPNNLGGGVVNLGGSLADNTIVLPTTPLTATGLRGAASPRIAVDFAPSSDFFASDVAAAIRNSINNRTLRLNINATVGQFDQRRVELVHQTGFSTDVTFQSYVGQRLRLEAPVDVVKQDDDLVRIIGHTITDAGPLGFDNALQGDQYGDFHSATRGQNNRFEGLYLDDFIIGFAERGEMVTGTAGNLGFTNNPDAGFSRTTGPYQLEIRQGPNTEAPLFTSFDTNDRMGVGVTLSIQQGLDIADGQIFTLSDGVQHVVFEYVDMTIPGNEPEPGRIGIPFLPEYTDYEVGQVVRDAINSDDVQAVLDVSAAMSDGTILGTGATAGGTFVPSTTGRVNVFGPVSLRVHATDVRETNDTIFDATPTGITGVDSPSYFGSGVIGDNPNFPLRTGMDVDLFSVFLAAGETIRIDVDAADMGSDLDPVLRVFDSTGTPFLFVNGRNSAFGLDYVSDLAAPGEYLRLDPYIEFTPQISGTYYVGVSGESRTGADNRGYDPLLEGSGVNAGSTGEYHIEMTFGSSTGNDFVLYNERGDSNHFRDQGQLLIQGNTISYSSDFAISIESTRGGFADDPQGTDLVHMGPVRNTPKLNQDNLTPGVVVSNNVLAGNELGGVRYSGDPGGLQSSAVPFGRIVNNTIVGGVASGPQLLSLINFETLPTGASAERVAITDQFLATHGVTFGHATGAPPILAQVGDPVVGFTPADTPAGSAAAGQFFLTDNDGAVGGPASDIVVTYNTPTQSVAGSLLDVNGEATGLAVGTGNEAWTITAFNAAGQAIGNPVIITAGGPSTGDGLATPFSIDAGASIITSVRFAYTGTRPAAQAGFALDNFYARGIPKVGAGIRVENNASPTLLNNIIAGLDTGISVDASSASTVIGGTLYQNNTNNTVGVVTEDFPIYLAPDDPLFRDAANGNFYLASLSQAIDSSVGSLLERFDFTQVKAPLGIAQSPIISPETDVTGQLRVDDPEVETPSGFGDNVYIDRGAVDRSDFVGPTAIMLNPRDNDADGLDSNPATATVRLDGNTPYSDFRIRLVDGVPPADPDLGSGIDDMTVRTDNLTISRDGILLVDGVDYSFSYNSTSDTIVLTPISGIWKPDATYVIKVNNVDHFELDAKAGPDLLDGQSFVVTDNLGEKATFEFESGYTLAVPQTLAIVVPEQAGKLGGISDGATFTIQRRDGTTILQTAVFEFDSNGQATDNNQDGTPDNFVVPFNVASTRDDIANAIVQQIQVANISLNPRNIGDGMVHLGSKAEHVVDITRAPSLQVQGQPSGVTDGGVFTIDDGTKIVTFEFDSDGVRVDADGDGSVDHPTSTLIRFRPDQTHDEIAGLIIQAVGLAELNLTPTFVGDGKVHLGGIPNVHIVDASLSNLTLSGQPGVRPAFGLQIPTVAGQPRLIDDGSGAPFLTDGDTFKISDGTVSITFELDVQDAPNGGLTTAPNTVVSIHSGYSVNQIADAIVAAIQSAPLSGLQPFNVGNGVIQLGEPTDGSSRHSLDVAQTGISQIGAAGVTGAIPVAYTPHETFDAGQVAVALIRAINNSSLDVVASPDGGGRVIVTGAIDVSAIAPVFELERFLPGVKDLAGNDLKPNLLTGETQMTIQLGNTTLDFGDGPQTPAGHYPTEIGQNGPAHVVTDNPIYLGSRLDADPDGQDSVGSDGDDLDSLAIAVNVAGANSRLSASGAVTPATIQLVSAPLTLTVPAGAAIPDNAVKFQVQNQVQGVTRSVLFEFTSDGAYTAGLEPVNYTAAMTAEEVAAEVVKAINRHPELQLSPASLGNGKVHIGSLDLQIIQQPSAVLSVSGASDFIQDGDFFSVGTDTFEFDDTRLDNGVTQGRIAVPFDAGTTQDQLIDAMARVIRKAGIGIAATNLGSGQLELDGDDEDGVVMGAFNRLTVTQVLVTASAAGLLDAWVDFNRDGDFNDAGEQIFASQQLTEGENAFEVSTPIDAVEGDTVARFRFSSQGGLKPTGLAADGEVEDWPVSIKAGLPPIANDDTYLNVSENGASGAPIGLSSVLNNDSDPDAGAGTPALVVANYQPISEFGAAIVMNPDGTFTYDPNISSAIQSLDDGESLVDTFTYRAKDGEFLSGAGTVSITVVGANDRPVAVTDPNVFTNQNTAINVDVLANDVDAEGHSLQLQGVVGGTGNVTVDTVNNVIHYDPAGKFNYLDFGQSATDTFTYTINDGKTVSLPGTVTITILGSNDSPVAVADRYNPAVPGDTRALADEEQTKVVDVLANDYDPEGKAIQIVQVQTVVTKGRVTINNQGTDYNTVTYNPDGKFETLGVGKTATDTFAYIVRDADGNTSLGSVTMTVQGRNDAPIATNDRGILVARNSTVTIDVLANDYDIDFGDVLSVDAFIPDLPTGNATVVNNKIVYDPSGQFDTLPIGQTRTDTFTYTVRDDKGAQSQQATVTVTIQGASDPPVALDDHVTTNEDTSINIFVLGNDTDDFGPMSVSSVNGAGLRGSVTLNQSTNAILYSPDSQFDQLAPNQTAIETFTYTVTDGIGSDIGTVTVTITGVNDAPIANVDANAYSVQRGGTMRADDVTGVTPSGSDDSVLRNDFDAEGDSLTARLIEQPQNGSLTFNSDGTFVYTHNGGGSTFDTFSYQAVDSRGAGSLQVVPVVISIVNAPAAEWQNPSNRYDVNNSGAVSPIDVLLVINLINDPNFGVGYAFPAPRPAGSYFYDTDGNGILSANDALGVINYVNTQNTLQRTGNPEAEAAPAAEGEAPVGLPSVAQIAAVPVTSIAPTVSEPEPAADDVTPWQTPQQPERSVNIDLWGIEDVVDAIAGEVGALMGERSELDEILNEMFA